MDPFDPFGHCPTPTPVWASYKPANVRGFSGPAFGLGLAFANTGGQDSSGADIQPIPPNNAGTTALDVAGVVYDGTPNTQFAAITTNLILKDIVETLRTKTIMLQDDHWVRARHVPGTTSFVYTLFGDLGPADALLEGVPPVTVPLAWDTMNFTGTQKGKLVAITDLAALFSPYELYSQAAEKLAWNAIDTAENDAIALVQGVDKGVAVDFALPLPALTTPEEKIIRTVVTLKKAEVPAYSDGNYHALISPADAAAVMKAAGPLGWTETIKYTNFTPIMNGELGTFRGIRFIESNRVADHKTVVMGPQALAWGDYQTIQAYRVAPGQDHADPLAQRGLLGWKGMWGMRIINFSGTPAAGPAGNPKGYRYTQVDLTS